MHEPSEPYSDPAASCPEDQPAWLLPAVIAGGTAVVILALVVVLAAWGLVRRRGRSVIQPNPPRVAQGEVLPSESVVQPAGVALPVWEEAIKPLAAEELATVASETDTQPSAASNGSEETATQGRDSTNHPDAPSSTESAPSSTDENARGPQDADILPPDDSNVTADDVAVRSTPADNTSVVRSSTTQTISTTNTGLRTVSRPARPDAGALDAAQRRLADTVGKEDRNAKTRAEKHTLAKSLLDRADDQDDQNLRYAMLDRARLLAIEAGDIRLPFAAIQQMEHSYETDPLPLKIDTLERLAAGVETGHDRLALAHLASDLGHEAADADRFDAARTMVDMGLNFARAIQDAQLQRMMAEQSAQLAADTARWRAANAARKALLQDVDDPVANLALGKYLCFVKGDWDTGLAHLVQGADSALGKIAEQDAARPTEAKEIVRLADAWYDWGRDAQGEEQHGAWSRAQEHYLTAKPNVTGSLRRAVNERLEEFTRALNGEPSQPTAVVHLPWLDGPVGQMQTYDGHTENITALAVSTSGNLLASASEDRSVRLWHLPTGKQIWQHSTETGNLNGVAITPDERFVISNHDNNQLVVLHATTGKPAIHIPTSARSPTDLAVSPDGQSLIWAARSRPPNMLMWSLLHNRPLAQFGDGDHPSVIDISTDGRSIVTGDARGAIRLWDTDAGVAVRDLAVHQDAITDIDLSPGCNLVASATFDKIDVRDLDTGESVLSFDVPSVRTVAFSPDGLRLISGGFREEVLMWELASGQQLASLRAERAFSDRQILRVACLPDPRGLVTGATDGKIRLWRLPD